MSSIWTEKDKLAAAEQVAQFRAIGATLGLEAAELDEERVYGELETVLAELEIPEPGSDARGRMVFAFQCEFSAMFERCLRRLEGERVPREERECQVREEGPPSYTCMRPRPCDVPGHEKEQPSEAAAPA